METVTNSFPAALTGASVAAKIIKLPTLSLALVVEQPFAWSSRQHLHTLCFDVSLLS